MILYKNIEIYNILLILLQYIANSITFDMILPIVVENNEYSNCMLFLQKDQSRSITV